VAGAIAITAIASLAQADTAPDPAATLLARANALTTEVAKLRGLKRKRPLDAEVVSKTDFHDRLMTLADDQTARSSTSAEGIALERWGLIPRGTDYLKLMVELLTDNVAGYYDSKTKKLTISRGATDDPAWADLVLAHEIDHGLQDQAFGLDKFQTLPAEEGDASVARRALVEGDAVALMIELALQRRGRDAPWADPSVARDVAERMAAPKGDVLDRAPLAIREAILFPYRAGFAFVAALRQREPWSAVDDAFKRPPRSTEQILHVDKYIADEKPVPVAFVPPASLSALGVIDSTVWGELGFQLFLRTHGIPAETAAQAAAGWGGDRVRTLLPTGETRASRAIGIARLVWDSEADAIEANDAAVRAVDSSLYGVTVEATDNRTVWLAVDGTVSLVERRGDVIVMAVGVPVALAQATIDDLALWAAAPPTQAKR
jgi:hypothetical protein